MYMNELTPYIGTYSITQPYWNPSVEQIPYVQQPPVTYYQPYDYQIIQPQYPVVYASPPTPVSKIPAHKPSVPFPAAPLGRTRESNIAYLPLDIPPQPIIPAPIPPPVIRAPIPPPVIPSPIPPPRSLPLPPRRPRQYHQRSPLPPPPRPTDFYRRAPPSPHDHHDRSSLPPVLRREKRHERNSHDRHSSDDRLIMSYFGRRHNIDRHRYPDRWYY